MEAPKFTFTFYRFTGIEGHRTTELVRDYAQADGMRALVERKEQVVAEAINRVQAWASSKGFSINAQEPYPSEKHSGKVWLEFRFGGLTL